MRLPHNKAVTLQTRDPPFLVLKGEASKASNPEAPKSSFEDYPKDKHEIAFAVFMARAGAAALVFFSAFAPAAFFAALAAAAFAMVKNREGQKDDRNGARSTDPQRNQGMLKPNCCRTRDMNLRTDPNNASCMAIGLVSALLR